ncbi:carboxypeptidase regulatory-like domain-containing protein [Gemmatimonas sp.]|uniref:carboxypeptidase regulatory-like domain-containing protein n=1 Tax=Gemmatimonas sp. TaxID=1962908 RepID=UPI003569B4D1
MLTKRWSGRALALAVGVLPLVTPCTALVAQERAPVSAVFTRVRGEVRDSVHGVALARATVQLVSSNEPGRIRSTTSNAAGQFMFDSVPAGIYLAGFLHPLLDTLGVESTLLRVEIETAVPITIALGTPSAATLIEARCGLLAPDRPPGLFFGTARAANGAPLTAAARVRAQYTTTTATAAGLSRTPNVRIATATAEGQFAVCGVPPGGVIVVRGSAGADSSGFVELPVPRNGLLVRDLLLGTGTRMEAVSARTTSVLRGAATLRGVARTAAGAFITGARLTVWGTGMEVATNAAGQYTFPALPEGTYTLEARAIGSQPVRVAVDLAARRDVMVDVQLSPLVATVDTMRVRANRAVPIEEFERRRRLGFGYFLDEEQIKAKRPTYMADIFRGTPGVVTLPGQFGRDQVRLRGTGMTGDCAPAIFLNGLYVPIEDGDLDGIFNPLDVRAIEIYARTSSIPLQFQTRNGCGSAVIWTGARTLDAKGR